MPSPVPYYAQALLQLADERGKRAAIVADCRELAALPADAFADLARAPKAQAKQVAAQVLSGAVQPETLDLVRLLIDRARLGLLGAIAGEAVVLDDRSAGTVRVHAVTAQPLDPAARERLIEGLRRASGQQVMLEEKVDPALIGGVTLRAGDILVDGSVRRQLAELKQLIQSAPAGTGLWVE